MRRQQVAKSESELEGLKKGHSHFGAFLSVESVWKYSHARSSVFVCQFCSLFSGDCACSSPQMVVLKCQPLSRVCSAPSHRTYPRSLLQGNRSKFTLGQRLRTGFGSSAPAHSPGAGSPCGLGHGNLVPWESRVLVSRQGCPGQPLCQGCASPAGHEGLEQAGERRELEESRCCRAAARSGGPQRPPFCGRAERPREACVVFTGREELSKPTGNRRGCCNVFWTAGFKNQRLPLSPSLSPPGSRFLCLDIEGGGGD